MSYQIGQLRYSGSGCVNVLNFNVSNISVSTSAAHREDATSFKDIQISQTGNTEFEANRDYYLRIPIPRDLNYDMTFNIKLIKGDTVTDTEYQFIKQITVNRGGDGTSTHPVALYESNSTDSNGKYIVKAMIPLTYEEGIVTQKDAIYLKSGNTSDQDEYYLGTGVRGYNPIHKTDSGIKKINVVQVSEIWNSESSNVFSYFEMIFRPVEAGFTHIVVQMVRTTEDYAIQSIVKNTDGTTSIQYGRIIDVNKINGTDPNNPTILLYSLNNLLDNISGIPTNNGLERIGVWSHPGLMMAINGEEIRVGPSGYYEDDVIPIISLGIVAADGDYNDNWTFDYTFNEETEATEGGA